jgi:DNA-binding CsgD family transcriptional regulator
MSVLNTPSSFQPLEAYQQFFAKAHDLTSSEARILGLLVDGCSISDIVRTSRRSHATVKTHLIRIFSKTFTSRQAELVCLYYKSVLTSGLVSDLAPEERLPRLNVYHQFWRNGHDGKRKGGVK